MTTDLLKLSSHRALRFANGDDRSLLLLRSHRLRPLPPRRLRGGGGGGGGGGRHHLLPPRLGSRAPRLALSNTLEASRPTPSPAPPEKGDEPGRRGGTSVLLDVSGMMCGGCLSRVKSVLSADARVESAVVNMLTQTAAVKLSPRALGGGGGDDSAAGVAESLAARLTECGFPAKRRSSRIGVAENVKKWEDMAKKKEELLAKSRNRVAFAWTLVALCCGSHASHILHSLGIHIAHGEYIELFAS